MDKTIRCSTVRALFIYAGNDW